MNSKISSIFNKADRVIAFASMFEKELNPKDYFILSGYFERCGLEKQKTKELSTPPITMIVTAHNTGKTGEEGTRS